MHAFQSTVEIHETKVAGSHVEEGFFLNFDGLQIRNPFIDVAVRIFSASFEKTFIGHYLVATFQ